MKKKFLLLGLMFLSFLIFSARFYKDSVGDLEHDPPWFFFWWIYKYLNPPKDAYPELVRYFKEQDLNFTAPEDAEEVITCAEILAMGDLMVREAMTPQNSSALFSDLKEEFKEADLVFANLEAPVVPDRAVSDFPRYNFRKEMVEFFKQEGIDIVSTANNHCLDQGPEGLLATLNYLDQLGLYHTGTARSEEERDYGFPVLEAGGIKIAFLGYTFSTNSRKIPKGKPWMVNRIYFNLIDQEPDLSLIEKHIKIARERGAEVVVVSLHWSLENEFYPPPRIVERAHKIMEMGADIIFGHHPHLLQPMERYLPKNSEREGLPEAFIIYSLGNLIPDQPSWQYRTTVVLKLELKKDEAGRVWIDSVRVIPVYFYPGSLTRRDAHLLRIERALNEPEKYNFFPKRKFKNLRKAKALIEEIFLPTNTQEIIIP